MYFRRLALAVLIRLQNETTCTRDILSTQQKIVNSISADYNSKVGEKQFSGVRKRRKSRESKFTVVDLRDRLAHHTSQLRVYKYKVCHGTQRIWGAKWVIMPLLCASLLYNINRSPIYK